MVVFFDIMALDDMPVLGLKQWERRQLLEKVVHCTPGRAQLAEYHAIQFSCRTAAAELRELWAKSITAHDEGLVMKPTDEPYFNFENTRGFRSCCIKLKKEYIGSFGDVGDFAIVGAAYDATKAKNYRIPNLQWTDFYIGCLQNKEDIMKRNAKPHFVIITTVSLKKEILKSFLQSVQIMSVPYATSDVFNIRIETGIAKGKKPAVIFTAPLVADVRCFSFDKNGGTGFWAPRFPEVTKIHLDRSYLDSITFSDLQDMALRERSTPMDNTAEDDLQWITQLETADPRGIAVDATTPRTSSSFGLTPSPRHSLHIDPSKHYSTLIRMDTNEIMVPNPIQEIDGLTSEPASSPTCHLSPSLFISGVSKGVGVERRPLKRVVQESPSIRDRSSKRPRALCEASANSTNTPHPVLRVAPASVRRNNANCREATFASSKENAAPYPTPPNEIITIAGSNNPLVICHSNSPALQGGAPLITIPNPISKSGTDVITIPEREMIRTCSRSGLACHLSNCMFLLAPCVAGMPYLTETLLPSHGRNFSFDVAHWVDSIKHSRRCVVSGKKIRKLVLVESNRKEATMEMLNRIRCLNLTRNGTKRDWVEVYDWRLLESLTKMEMGHKLTYDAWRRNWVGAV
jgi:DNA ligase-4